MAYADVLRLSIYCVDCNQPLDRVEIEEIEYGQFMACPHCKSRFNLWSLYLNFYENILLARKIADSVIEAVWGPKGYTVKGEKNDLFKVNEFLNVNEFGNLLKEIVFDTTVFGQSFVERTGSIPVALKRIDPTSVEAKIGLEEMSGGGPYTKQIEKVVEYRQDGSIAREVPRENLIVFISRDGLSRPTGHSVFGLWLHHWFSLKLAPQALINTSFMGMKWDTKELDWLREYVEDSVIIGSGVPKWIVRPEIRDKVPPTALKMLEQTFRYSTIHRRKRLADMIEKEIFSLALGREYDFDDWPTFVWLD